MNDAHSLLLTFDTDDSEFVRGFELGRLWAALRAEPDMEVVQDVHAGNVEMLMRMAEATGRTVAAVELDDVWLTATFLPSGVIDSP